MENFGICVKILMSMYYILQQKVCGKMMFVSIICTSYRYYHENDQVRPTSSSYINLTMKLLIKSKNSPKNRAKMKFCIFREAVSQFCFK